MARFIGGAMLVAACAMAMPVAASATAAPSPIGIWRNGGDSVRIRIARCGAALCGTVVRASAKARADAARGGTARLVGTRLLRDFRARDARRWEGEVFVPDIGVTFSGTLALDGPDRLVGRGCVLGRLGCREQAWRRVR